MNYRLHRLSQVEQAETFICWKEMKSHCTYVELWLLYCYAPIHEKYVEVSGALAVACYICDILGVWIQPHQSDIKY